MSDTKKPEAPRELYIIDSPMSRMWVVDSPLRQDHQEKDFEIRMIEHSAYEALKKERDELKAELDELKTLLRSRENWVERLCEERDELDKEVERLTKLNIELRREKPNAGSTDTLTEKYNLRKERDQWKDIAEKLATALEGFNTLLDSCVLVRNTDDDADIMKFMKQGARITGHLSAVQSALAEYEKMKGEK